MREKEKVTVLDKRRWLIFPFQFVRSLSAAAAAAAYPNTEYFIRLVVIALRIRSLPGLSIKRSPQKQKEQRRCDQTVPRKSGRQSWIFKGYTMYDPTVYTILLAEKEGPSRLSKVNKGLRLVRCRKCGKSDSQSNESLMRRSSPSAEVKQKQTGK